MPLLRFLQGTLGQQKQQLSLCIAPRGSSRRCSSAARAAPLPLTPAHASAAVFLQAPRGSSRCCSSAASAARAAPLPLTPAHASAAGTMGQQKQQQQAQPYGVGAAGLYGQQMAAGNMMTVGMGAAGGMTSSWQHQGTATAASMGAAGGG
eukprot:scaffold20542_cov17-Tisochrysis_lutea.AAC.1